jgi:hypothetical protein
MQVGDAPRGWFKWQGAEARILLIISVSNDLRTDEAFLLAIGGALSQVTQKDAAHGFAHFG